MKNDHLSRYFNGVSIKIDKNVKMPESFDKRCKYPWRLMEVGDSFYVPKLDYEDEATTELGRIVAQRRLIASIRSVINYQYKKYTKRFVCCRDGYGVRVWRTE